MQSRSPTPWQPAPSVRPASYTEVHVYRFPLTLPQSRLNVLYSYLSAKEQFRSARYVTPLLQNQFIAAHGQLREILAGYTGQPPGCLTFIHNDNGKPFLTAPDAPRFNLTHSRDLALLAVAFEREVGVDIENITRSVDFPAIAWRFFAPGEVQALFSLPAEQQLMAFFRCWTRKEAYIKAQGSGLAIPLDQFEVTLAPFDPARIMPPVYGWSLHSLDPGPGFIAALAVQGEIVNVRCFDWSPLPEG